MSIRTRLSLTVAIAVVAICIGIWMLIPATRFVYGVAPIAYGEAVLLTRRNEAHDTELWAQLVRSDGAVVWSRNTDDLSTIEALGFSGVAASTDRVLLLGTRGGATFVRALDREHGALQWETKIADGVPLWIGAMLHTDGPRAYAIHGVHGRLTALALADGAVLWTGDDALGKDAAIREVAVLAPDRLMVATRESAPVVLDGSTGAVLRSLPMQSFECATPHSIIGTDAEGFVRVSVDDAGPPPQHIILEDGLRVAFQGPCGTCEGDLVLAGERDDRAGNLLMRVDQRGHTRWSVALRPGAFVPHASADGRLPRYLPIVMHDEGPTQRTVIVDLDDGTRLAEHAHADHRMTFVTESRALVVSIFDVTVFTVDHFGGSLERATRFTNAWGNEVRPQDFRFGEIWLHGTDWGSPAKLGWAVMGLETGDVHVNGTVQSTDVTSAGWSGG